LIRKGAWAHRHSHTSNIQTVTAMIRKRSITLHGHRTSFSVEDAFLDELKTIARKRGLSFAALIAEIDESRALDSNLSSALRLFVLRELKQAAASM
jgi:predicted DNA-binding ribbon-helix-helix protein